MAMRLAWASGDRREDLLFRSEFLSHFERFRGGDLDVGFDAGSLPVRLRDRVDRSRERHPDHEVIVDAVAGDRVRTAARGLADNRGALEVLQVVGEFLGAREGPLGGQNEYGLA